MRQFRFIGNGVNDPATIKMYGAEFALNGDPVAVENGTHAAKLAKNSHFEEVGGKVPASKPQTSTQEPDAGNEGGEGDAEPTKEELMAEAKALGLKVAANIGVAKLKAKIAEAKGE